MFDFLKSTNQQLVDMIRAMHEDQGKVIPASSTLLRLKKDELLRRVATLMGKEMGVDERGEPVVLTPAVLEVTETPAEVAAEFQAALDVEGVDPESDDPLAHDFGGNKDAVGGYHEIPADETDSFNSAHVSPEGTGEHLPAETAEEPKTRGARARHGDDEVLTVLAAKNPKKEGSAAYVRWSCMKTGQTVGEYIALVNELQGEKSDARGTLAKAIRRGEVSVAAKEG